MPRICCRWNSPFWVLRFTVCYHDSKSMLPIATDSIRPSQNHENIDIFGFFFDSLNCILDVLLCFFGNQEVLFWSFSLSRCYQDYKSMLSIAFNFEKMLKFLKIRNFSQFAKLYSERSLMFFL